MKNKVLFLCLILILSASFGVYFFYTRENQVIENWVLSIETKNQSFFNENTEIDPFIDSIVKDYSLYIQKTEKTDSSLIDALSAIKHNFLGFLYKNFDKDIKLIIDSYFNNQEEFSLFYDNENILGFIKKINFKTVQITKTQPFLYKISFKINELTSKTFQINIVTSLINNKEKIIGLKDFYIFLSELEKEKQNILNKKNDLVKKNINSSTLITFFETKLNTYKGKDESLNFQIFHSVKIKNTTTRPIFGTKIKIWDYNKQIDQSIEKIVLINKTIAPDSEIEETFSNTNPQFHYFIDNFGQYPKIEIIYIDFLKEKLEYQKDFKW